jgi:autotransporter adhesin
MAINGSGARPTATGSNAIAMGSGANASGNDAVAIGTGAQATDGAAVAIGLGNIASGNGAVAIGDPNHATGRGAVAIGADNRATGLGAVAIGADSVAEGRSAIALGSNARATAAGAVAIGENAVADRPGQVALGSTGSTYTLAGIGSAASRAAQSGPLNYVTSDAAGNLALSDFGPNDLALIRFDLDRVRRDARSGTAAAMAMGYAPMPSAPGRTSYSLNGSTFREAQAIGGAIAHRLDTDNPFALTAGFAYAGHGNNAVRVGVAGEF